MIWITARTEVDKINRMVTLLDLNITKQSFPTLPNNGSAYASALLKDLPWNKTVALDLLEADLAVTDAAAKQKTFELQNTPPIIYFSTQPAVLALVDGKPVLQPTADNFQKVVNTRSLIVYDPKKYSYYLALMDGWMESPTVEGPWTISHRAPTKDLEKIEKGAVSTKSNQPLGNPQESLKTAEEEGILPKVYVSTVPAELLVTQGEPVLTAIPGTSLQYVSNTGAEIFFDTGNQSLLRADWRSLVLDSEPGERAVELRGGRRAASGLRQDSDVQSEVGRAGLSTGNSTSEGSGDRELDSADGCYFADGAPR